MSYQYDTTQLRSFGAVKVSFNAPSARILSRRVARQARRQTRAL